MRSIEYRIGTKTAQTRVRAKKWVTIDTLPWAYIPNALPLRFWNGFGFAVARLFLFLLPPSAAKPATLGWSNPCASSMFLSPLPFQHSASKDESSPALGQTTYNEKNMNERNFFPASICFQVTAADNFFLFIHGGLLHDFFKMFLRLEQFLTLILTINTSCACAL